MIYLPKNNHHDQMAGQYLMLSQLNNDENSNRIEVQAIASHLYVFHMKLHVRNNVRCFILEITSKSDGA